MPSYDVHGGKVIGAPASVQKSWNEFNGSKMPLSAAKDLKASAAGTDWKTDAKLNRFKG